MKASLLKIYTANLEDFGELADAQIMGLTIYAEARGESREGRIAVGTVILERVTHRKWDGETVQEVCLWPKQFSCYNPGDPNRAALLQIARDWDHKCLISIPLQECYTIARGLLAGSIPEDPDLAAANCCQYMTPAAAKRTRWDDAMTMVKQIGGHQFFA